MRKRGALPLLATGWLIAGSGTAGAADPALPADLLSWPTVSVPPESFPPEARAAAPLLKQDLQSELWKKIPSAPPEDAQNPSPVEPTLFQSWLRRPPRAYIGVGLLADQLGRFATSPSGTSSFASSAYFSIAGSLVLPIEPFWKLSLWIADTPIRKSTFDGGEGTALLLLGARALRVFRLTEGWTVEPLVGLGLMQYLVAGSGGTVQLNNGNGVTQFGFPSDSSTATLFFVEAGAAITLWRFRWENSLIGTGVATSRRSFSYLSTLSFGVL